MEGRIDAAEKQYQPATRAAKAYPSNTEPEQTEEERMNAAAQAMRDVVEGRYAPEEPKGRELTPLEKAVQARLREALEEVHERKLEKMDSGIAYRPGSYNQGAPLTARPLSAGQVQRSREADDLSKISLNERKLQEADDKPWDGYADPRMVADPSSLISSKVKRGPSTYTPDPTLTTLKHKQLTLMDELHALQSQVGPQAADPSSLRKPQSEESLRANYRRQAEILLELNGTYLQMQQEYAKTPALYSEQAKQATASFYETAANTISKLYGKLWYNTGDTRDNVLFGTLYLAFYQLSFINGNVSLGATISKSLFEADKYAKDKAELDFLKANALEKHKGNDAFDGNGYIKNQKALTRLDGSPITYSATDSPNFGCGWVSAYNALKILGNDPDPYTVMRDMEPGALDKGKVGTDPFYLQKYFQNQGYRVRMYFTQEDVEREAYRSDACIFVYGYLGKDGSGVPCIGAHYIAGYPQSDSTGNMRFFNDSAPEVGPLSSHYANNQIFRFIICINEP